MILISLLAGVIAVLGTVARAEESVDEVVDKLQAQYDQTGDFSALFTQELDSKAGTAVANGKISIKKPGMMRVSYTSPKKWETISDGETTWLYDPDLKEVRVYKASEAFENLPFLKFLFGKGKVKDDFTASFGNLDKDKANDFYLIILAPKTADTSIDRVVVLVSKNDYMIHQLNTYDITGNVMRIVFKDIAINSGIKDSTFHFIAPSGVTIVPIANPPALPKPEVKIKIEE
jgi:outer membrane lipoprotein carrier protein